MLDEFAGVTPQLTVSDTDAAVRFYTAAFGADELLRNHDPDGRVMHCELLVGGGRVLVHDEFPERGSVGPRALGGTPVVLHLYVADVDAVFAAAVEAGAKALMEPQDAFWGDRYAMVEDPFGHHWSMAHRLADPSVAELEERADRWAAGE
ncbi:VOC family protein [Amycolatopsis suaedae]|uniref:VOC family protein n=1 Tax=Amycolatopsis suaedae TaxID=2510978 RepID=A0A4Q7JG45_9PSEU|nr:VOC family protein [Amycolatopsis suaedae]RZQ65973.1 VOC family protein [Amycolatopsis suaedae]